ncbi:MAG: hypothetical protein R2880_01090 [Deinococcales bacterium]
MIPCELIEGNGERLKELVRAYARLWGLGGGFREWLGLPFYTTLVDRIVSGHPSHETESLKTRLGYEDKFLTVSEPFYLFAIEGPSGLTEPCSSIRLTYPVSILFQTSALTKLARLAS